LILPGGITSFSESSTTDGSNVSCPGFGTCEFGEKLVWTVGELEAGQSKTLLFETGAAGGATAGDLQRFRGVASASRGEQQVFAANYGIDASPVMALGLAGDPGPVAAGAEYVYRLDYGALGGADDATLRLELPAGVTFQSATGGGTESGGIVTWNLGALNPGDGGERTVTVTVDGSLPNGALLQARATLDSGDSAEQPVRASYTLAVRSSVLALRVIRVSPPVQPSAPVDYTIEIVNNGGLTLTNPVLRFILPGGIISFSESSTTDGSNVSCPGPTCDFGEKLVWTPGDLIAGGQRTLQFSTTVWAPTNVREGDLLRHRLVVDADGAQQRYEAFDLPIVDESDFTIPVELTSFTTSLEGEAVALAWSTATETNNAGFDVERSTDGETFTTIGFEPGVGTTEEAQSYRFVDRDAPFATTLFYRLRQVDTDGTFEYSPVVEVEVTPSAVALLPVAPNPVVGFANLRYELPEATAVRLQVFDLLGRRVATLADGEKPAGRHEVSWRSAGLASGTYFVRLQAGSTAQTQMLRLVR
jgi:uncharacterized repeat protein (TIGR01451 family)